VWHSKIVCKNVLVIAGASVVSATPTPTRFPLSPEFVAIAEYESLLEAADGLITSILSAGTEDHIKWIDRLESLNMKRDRLQNPRNENNYVSLH